MSEKKTVVKKTDNKKSNGNNKIRSRDWTTDEEQILCCMREEGIEYKYIGLELKRTIHSCRNKYRDTIWETKPWYDTYRAALKSSVKKSHLETIARANDRRVDLSKVRMDIVSDRLATAISSIPRVPKPHVNKKKRKHSPEDIGIVLSDAHIGHVHTLEETGGLAQYNLDIFEKRINNLKLSIGDIYELHSQLYEIPNLHIFCLGDMVAGMNNTGAWSSVYISSDVHEQVIVGSEAVADLIYDALHIFKDVYFYGVYGNHGRGSLKGLEKEYINWDYICYEYIEHRFKDNPRVHFVIPKTWWILREIRNHKFLILHGDDIKSGGMNAPLGNLIKTQNMLMTMIREIPDYTIIGHFHSAGEWSTNNGKIIVNGSFIGPDIFALKNLQRSSRAEQKIFGIHDKRGITWRYDIDLDVER